MTSAPGSSHDIMLPNSALNRRVHPVGPHMLHAPPPPPPPDAARLVAGQPAEAVVAEDQVEDAVVLRAADVGPVGGRGQRDRGHPPSGGDHDRDAHHAATCQTRRHHPVGAARR